MKTIYAALAGLAVIALAGGGWYAVGGGDDLSQCTGGTVAGGDVGGPFELVSETGETVTDAEVIDRPTLIYFGYTFCPDVCPLDAARNAEVTERLAEEGFDVKPVFVSVDPARDTPEELAAFTDYLHPRMLGLTGTRAQIDAVTGAYKVYYRIHDDDDGSGMYLVDHTAFTYLMMPGRGFVDFYRTASQSDAAEITERVACVLRNV